MMCSRLSAVVPVGFAIALTLGLAACASSPVPVYLTMDAPTVSAAIQPQQRVVVVGPVSVPDTIDRPQLMLNAGPGRLEAAPNLRWAQPYKLEVARVLAANLAHLLANPRVVPASSAVATSAPEPFVRVAVDVLKLEQQEGEHIDIEVLWSVRESATAKVLASQRSVLRETVTGIGGDAIAVAQSRAWARLAAEIAPALK